MKNKTATAKSTAPTPALNARLAAYSATATAALLIVPSAEAGIVNLSGSTTPFQLTSSNTSFPLNLSPFQARFSGSARVVNGTYSFGRVNLRDGQFLNVSSFDNSVRNLGLGDALAGGSFQGTGLLVQDSRDSGFRQLNGQFQPGSAANAIAIGYVGLKTVQNGKTYYGWLRLKVSNNADGKLGSVSLLAVDGIVGAYDTKDDVIVDSFAAGTIAATPEPSVAALGGLALLACGAVGVREQRRRQAAAKKGTSSV